MSTLDSSSAATARPSAPGSLVALYRLLLRMQITVPRLLGITALGALSVVIGAFSRWDSDPSQAAADAVSSYGLGLVVPVAATALAAGAGDVALPALLAASLAGFAYAGVFVAAGLWFRRAAWWGLAFVLLGERRRQPRGGFGSIHRRRLGELRPRDRAGRGGDAGGGLGRHGVRRAPGGGARRVAGCDVALPQGGHRLASLGKPVIRGRTTISRLRRGPIVTRSSARGASTAARDP